MQCPAAVALVAAVTTPAGSMLTFFFGGGDKGWLALVQGSANSGHQRHDCWQDFLAVVYPYSPKTDLLHNTSALQNSDSRLLTTSVHTAHRKNKHNEWLANHSVVCEWLAGVMTRHYTGDGQTEWGRGRTTPLADWSGLHCGQPMTCESSPSPRQLPAAGNTARSRHCIRTATPLEHKTTS